MFYRSYNNGGNFFWLGLILFLFLGGFKTLALIIPLFFLFIPLIGGVVLFFTIIRMIAKNKGISSHIQSFSQERTHFVELLVHILVHVVKADGRKDDREIQLIMRFFQLNMRYSPQQLAWVRDLIDHSIKNHFSLEECCLEFHRQFNMQSKMVLLELLYQVAVADSQLTASEESVIEKVVQLLQIGHDAHQTVRSRYHVSPKKDYFQILGIGKTASPEEIKRAYKKACKAYHPDKVQHLGEEFRKVAEEKIKEINEAYAYLKK